MRTKTDYSYRWRGLKVRFPLLLLSAVFFYFGFQEIQQGHFGIWTGAFGLSVVAGLIFESVLRRSYQCPDSQTTVGKAHIDKERNDEFFYVCSTCDIQWYTKTYVPKND